MNFIDIIKEELTVQQPSSPVDGLALAKQLANVNSQIEQLEQKSEVEKKQAISQLEKMKQEILLKIKNIKQVPQQVTQQQSQQSQQAQSVQQQIGVTK